MEKEKNKEQQTKKSNAKKIAIIGLGIAAVGAGTYFGWQYFKSQKNKNVALDDDEETVPYTPSVQTTPVQTSYTPAYVPSTTTSSFPLKKGSRGEKVRQLQNALISRYGASVLPKYGADGDFGSEMATALANNGWPATIDETTFNVITAGSSSSSTSSFYPMTTATNLYLAVVLRNFDSVLKELKKFRNVEDYKSANEYFKKKEIGGVSWTIVNALLTKFTDSSQKDQFRKEFLRMGLKFDGSKWSLSGLNGAATIITLHPTVIWDYPNKRIRVEENVVLGYPIETKKGFTLFQTMDGKRRLIVKEKSVRIIQNN
ncbi:MAG TPA: hypothetical protein PK637_00895 [Flavobacteriales bacterium]|nr:hypothetical protein [Flavobacteriales bacterium]HRE95289.1 hypothetical protein [Flavobacteriales bacterium]HRJ37218.1 hypothetical protein [Flavobacteriales bacterium]